MKQPANAILISKSEALQIIESPALEILILEVVSDYYLEPVLQAQRPSNQVLGFAQIRTERFETAPLWNLHSDAHLQQVLTEYALVPGIPKHILLFDTIQLACGNAQSRFDASARLLSILYYFGFPHISIILDPAINATFPTEVATRSQNAFRRLTSDVHLTETGLSQEGVCNQERWVPKHRDHFVNYQTMVQLLAGKLGSYHLLDARSAEEYAGVFTGYDYIPLAGRIPTAENVINGDYQVSEKESLPEVLARLAATLKRKGISSGDRIVWYCGTGWRASRMCVLTQALGYTNVGIYDGGWNEWHQRHPEHGREKPWWIGPSGSPGK